MLWLLVICLSVPGARTFRLPVTRSSEPLIKDTPRHLRSVCENNFSSFPHFCPGLYVSFPHTCRVGGVRYPRCRAAPSPPTRLRQALQFRDPLKPPWQALLKTDHRVKQATVKAAGNMAQDYELSPSLEPKIARKKLVASLVVGIGASMTLLASICFRTMPLGKRAFLSIAPLAATLLPYFLCVARGLPLVNVGSWRSLNAIGHRLGGIGALLLPLVLVVREALTNTHAPGLLYGVTVATILMNLLFGVALIPSRFPAYDIPAARGLAVGTLYGLAFLGWSTTFRFGGQAWYAPIGRLSALVAAYAVAFSWSDAGQNIRCWQRGMYKTKLGRKWYLPFERSSLTQVFGSNLWRQPSADALDASLMTAWQGCAPTVFVALLGSSALLQLPYLLWGSAYTRSLTMACPALTRWATYQALAAVAANNFATFLVTLVVHSRLPLHHVAFYNVLVPLIPTLNIAAFCWRYPGMNIPLILQLLLRPPGAGCVEAMPAAWLS